MEALISKVPLRFDGVVREQNRPTNRGRWNAALLLAGLFLNWTLICSPANAQSPRTFVKPRLFPATLDANLGSSESIFWAGRTWHFPKKSLMTGTDHPPPVVQFEWREAHFSECCTTADGLVRIFLSQNPLLPVDKTVMFSSAKVRLDNTEISGFRFLSSMRARDGSYSQYFVAENAGMDSKVTLLCEGTQSAQIMSRPGQCELRYMQFEGVSVLVRSRLSDRSRLPALYRDVVDFLDRASR
jgi:hypothetical protein